LTWGRTNKIPLLDPDGNTVGVLGTFEDITERRQALDALERSEEKYKNLVETTDTGYSIIDVEGRLIDANAEYVRLTGRSTLDEILGRSVLDWTAPYHFEKNATEIRKCMELGMVRDLEMDYIAPNGSITPIEINATVIDTHEGLRILTLCRDISERTRAEEERRAYEKQLDEQKQQFYKETILNVTDGKLDICGAADIESYIANTLIENDVPDNAAVAEARHDLVRLYREHGLAPERIDQMIMGAGEAITNAIKHGMVARIYAGVTRESVWVGVSDKGNGIDSLILPKAILRRGYSTRPSLGLGYSIMLDVADRLLLNTGANGTTVILVKDFQEPKPHVSLEQIADTW
jgi:PAS domain S-box-containing protein